MRTALADGTYQRSAADSRVVAVDFGREADFAAAPLTAAAVQATDPAMSVTAAADVTARNLAKFRVSGGAVGASEIRVTGTNGADVLLVVVPVVTTD